MVLVKITCGCNTLENPVVFDKPEEALKHSVATGHTLHGQITISK